VHTQLSTQATMPSLTVYLGAIVAVAAVYLAISDQADGIIRLFYPKPNFTRADVNPANVKNKIFLITGANSGLGFASAKLLAEAGGIVIMAARDKVKGQAAADQVTAAGLSRGRDGRAVFLPLDLADHKSIKQFALEVQKQFKRIDVLMLNAGIMATDFGATKDGFELQAGVNHFGHFYLTELLLDMLVRSKNPTRIVSLTSGGHFLWSDAAMDVNEFRADHPANRDRRDMMWKWKFYGRSKLLNILHMKTLSDRLQAAKVSHIYCNAAHPGSVATELFEDFTGSFVFKHFGTLIAVVVGQMPVEYGVLTQLYAAVSPDIEEKNIRGQYLTPLVRITRPSDLALNTTLGDQLFDYSKRVVAEWERTG